MRHAIQLVMLRNLLFLFGLLFTLAVTAQADVAPYPAWHIVTNGTGEECVRYKRPV